MQSPYPVLFAKAVSLAYQSIITESEFICQRKTEAWPRGLAKGSQGDGSIGLFTTVPFYVLFGGQTILWLLLIFEPPEPSPWFEK